MELFGHPDSQLDFLCHQGDPSLPVLPVGELWQVDVERRAFSAAAPVLCNSLPWEGLPGSIHCYPFIVAAR